MPTFDAEEKELLESKGIPLTDPTTTTDVDETHKPEDTADETTKDDAGSPEDAPTGGDAAADADGDGKPDGAGDVPATVTDATPAAGGTGAADGGGDGDVGKSGQPTTPPASSVTPPAAPEPSAVAKRLAEVEALILSDDHDPFSADGKKLQLEHNRLSAEVVAEPLLRKQRQDESYRPYTQQYPEIPQADMEKSFNTHAATYAKRGLTGDALIAAATVAMEFELQSIANGKKGAAAAAAGKGKPGAKIAPPVVKPPLTKPGAIVAPPATIPVAAPRREMTDEEELVENMRKMHPAGMRRTLRG